MGVKLEDLMAELSPQDLRDVNARTRKHVKAIEEASRLDTVRKALGRTQQEVAARMGIGQNAVSQLESRDDLRLSTLHKFVEGMGLHLELALVGSSGQRVVLKNYRPWEAAKPPGSAKKFAKSVSAKTVPARQKQAGASVAKNIPEALRQLPQQEILALATSLHAIARAQVAAGKRLTPREQMILDEAARILPNHLTTTRRAPTKADTRENALASKSPERSR